MLARFWLSRLQVIDDRCANRVRILNILRTRGQQGEGRDQGHFSHIPIILWVRQNTESSTGGGIGCGGLIAQRLELGANCV